MSDLQSMQTEYFQSAQLVASVQTIRFSAMAPTVDDALWTLKVAALVITI